MDIHYDDNLTRHTTHVSQKIVSVLDLTMKISGKKSSIENSIYSREGEATLYPKWGWRRTTTMVLVMVRQLEKRTPLHSLYRLLLFLSLLPPLL